MRLRRKPLLHLSKMSFTYVCYNSTYSSIFLLQGGQFSAELVRLLHGGG